MKSVYMLLFCSAAFAMEEEKKEYILSTADWQILVGVVQSKILINQADQTVTNLLNALNNTSSFLLIPFIPYRLQNVLKLTEYDCELLHNFVHLCTSNYMQHVHAQEVKKHQQTNNNLQEKMALPSYTNEFLQTKLDRVFIKKEK